MTVPFFQYSIRSYALPESPDDPRRLAGWEREVRAALEHRDRELEDYLNTWTGAGGGGGAGGVIQVDTYSTPGTATWSKPDGAAYIVMFAVGAGAGGQGGPVAPLTSNVDGGCGGGGGARAVGWFLASEVPSTLNVRVQAGGTGGASRSTTGAGNFGTGRAQSDSFDTGAYEGTGVNAFRFETASAPIATSTSGGSGGSPFLISGAGSASASAERSIENGGAGGGALLGGSITGRQGAATQNKVLYAAGGGGGGGGGYTSIISRQPGAGGGGPGLGGYFQASTQSSLVANAGAAGANGGLPAANGGPGIAGNPAKYGGTGGGGGGGSTGATTSGNGGAGAWPGGGGGAGGGASGGTGGAGGNGGDGGVVIVTFGFNEGSGGGGGSGNLELAWSVQGPVATGAAAPYRVRENMTLIENWLGAGTASSSGSVTVRLTISSTDYDTTIASGVTTGGGVTARSVPVAAGTILTPQVTAAGTGAQRLTYIAVLEPT